MMSAFNQNAESALSTTMCHYRNWADDELATAFEVLALARERP